MDKHTPTLRGAESILINLSENLKKLGHNVEKILIKDDHKKFLGKFLEQDLVFNALHGGKGEDGEIQEWMDNNNIKYTGSGATSSALCMDKARSKTLARIKSGQLWGQIHGKGTRRTPDASPETRL